MSRGLLHSSEGDVEEGTGRSIEIENEDKDGMNSANGAASPFPVSRPSLENSSAQNGGLGTTHATGRAISSVKGFPDDASGIDGSRDINIGQLVAEISDADQNRRINLSLRELKDIVNAAAENSAAATGGGADATRLTRLPPAPTLGPQKIRDGLHDEEAPFSVHRGVGGDLLSPPAEPSPLFADESSTQNAAPVSPLSRSLAGLSPVTMLESIADSQSESNKARGGIAQPRDFGDGPAPPAAIQNEFGDKISKKIGSAFPGQVGGIAQPRGFGDGPAPPTAVESEFGDGKIFKKIRSGFPEQAGGIARPRDFSDGPAPPAAIEDEFGDKISKKIRSEFPGQVGGIARPRDFGDGPAPPAAIEDEFGDKISKKIRSAFPEHVQDLAGPHRFAASGSLEDNNPTRKSRGKSTNEARNNHGRATRAEGDGFGTPTPLKFAAIEDPGSSVPKAEEHRDIESTWDSTPDELSPPTPFRFPEFGDPSSSAAKAERHRGVESTSISTPDEADRDVGPFSRIGRPRNVGNRDGGARPHSDASNSGASSSVAADPPDNANAGRGATPMAERDRNESLLRSESLLKIPEAFLVEERDDEEVIIATHVEPPLPLWKQKRVVCAAILFVAAVSAVAAGASIASIRNSETGVDTVTEPMSDSFPSISPVPSSSSAPSSSPTACALTISANAERLEMPLKNPHRTKMRIEGRHAVVVSRESETETIHIIFYVLKADGWERGNHFIEDDSLGRDTFGDEFNTLDDATFLEKVSVAFNGETALIGFPFADLDGKNSGTVFVYQRNAFGVWEKRDAPLAPRDEDSLLFGYSVDLDGDLACVISNPDYLFGFPRVYIFRNGGDEWAQIRRLDLRYPPQAKECFVSGDTIAVQIGVSRIDIYQIDAALDRYERLQEPLIILSDQIFSVGFSRDLLVYLTGIRLYDHDSGECYVQKNAFIHSRQDVNQPYTFKEQINSTRDGECVSPDVQATMSLDKDIMVLGGLDQTRLLLQSDGYWEEALALDQSYYGYSISGRNVLAVAHNDTTGQDEIHYFNIEDCALSPTQMPSSSAAPSSSKLPTPSPSVEQTFKRASVSAWGYTPFTLPPTERRTPTLTPTTPKRPTTHYPTGNPLDFCPEASVVGCTAVDPSNPVDECPIAGVPCPNDIGALELCCRDACQRNYCKMILPVTATPIRPTTYFPTVAAMETPKPTPVTRSPTTSLRPPTQFQTRAPCPEASVMGCTAVDPSNIVDECPTVGDHCPNGIPGELCCRDFCHRNYCTLPVF